MYLHVHVCLYRPFATRSEDHDHHMTVFPSLRPAGRHEVIALKVDYLTAWQAHQYTVLTYSALCPILCMYICWHFLQHTLDAMLERAGVASDLKDSDLKGPTEVGVWAREREREGGGGREGERETACMKVDILQIFTYIHVLISDAQPSRACSKRADHLQHLFPWVDSPGQHSVCGEGEATGQH